MSAELELILTILEQGGATGMLVLIAYFMWKMERNLHGFTEAFKASMILRDKKLEDIHDDIKRTP